VNAKNKYKAKYVYAESWLNHQRTKEHTREVVASQVKHSDKSWRTELIACCDLSFSDLSASISSEPSVPPLHRSFNIVGPTIKAATGIRVQLLAQGKQNNSKENINILLKISSARNTTEIICPSHLVFQEDQTWLK
jgi:hypothetical protein